MSDLLRSAGIYTSSSTMPLQLSSARPELGPHRQSFAPVGTPCARCEHSPSAPDCPSMHRDAVDLSQRNADPRRAAVSTPDLIAEHPLGAASPPARPRVPLLAAHLSSSPSPGVSLPASATRRCAPADARLPRVDSRYPRGRRHSPPVRGRASARRVTGRPTQLVQRENSGRNGFMRLRGLDGADGENVVTPPCEPDDAMRALSPRSGDKH